MAGPQTPGVRITVTGTLPGSEQWASSFWLDDVLIASQANLDDLLSVVNTALAGQIGAVTKSLSTSSAISQLTARYYAAGQSQAGYQSQAAVLNGVGTGGDNLPNQTCFVISLRTGLPGRRNRGRMYWPANGLPMGPDGLFQSGSPVTVLNGIASWFGDINNPGSTEGGAVSVLSRLTGAAQRVTLLSADRRPDIQRRRANKVVTPSPNTANVTQPA